MTACSTKPRFSSLSTSTRRRARPMWRKPPERCGIIDLTVRYLKGLEPVRKVSGSAVFDGDRLEFTPTGGWLRGLQVTGGALLLTELGQKVEWLTVDLPVAGTAARRARNHRREAARLCPRHRHRSGKGRRPGRDAAAFQIAAARRAEAGAGRISGRVRRSPGSASPAPRSTTTSAAAISRWRSTSRARGSAAPPASPTSRCGSTPSCCFM